MKVAVRADASSRIGTGHVARCLALADALAQRGAEVHFLMRPAAGGMEDAVRSSGHRVLHLAQDDELAASAALLGNIGRVDWLVVDHYALDASWEAALHPAVGQLLAIDDLGREHACDLLLDANLRDPHDHPYLGCLPAACTALLGPEFALLRREFAPLAAATAPRSTLRRILVSFGGADPGGATELAVAALASLEPGRHASDVICGAGNPRYAAIARLCAAIEGCRCLRHSDDLAAMMAAADLGLGGAGVSALERLALRLPALIVTLADNQNANAREIDRRGAARWLGALGDVGAADIAAAIAALAAAPAALAAMSQRAGGIVDGCGAQRVAQRMLEWA